MAFGSDDSNGFSMSPDQIFITDVGTDRKDKAFYWLSIGGYVYDHNWNEIALQRLEREIDPNDVMNPVILRGHLWKTVSTRFWQVDDGHQLGPMPSQPGLDARLSSIYYGHRRARQAAHWADAAVDHVGQYRQGTRQVSYADKAPRRRHRVRRTKSCNGIRRVDEELSAHERQTPRQRSVDRICFPCDTFEPNNDETEVMDIHGFIGMATESETECRITHHARKASVGPDSGVGIGSDDEDELRIELMENRSLDEQIFWSNKGIVGTPQPVYSRGHTDAKARFNEVFVETVY